MAIACSPPNVADTSGAAACADFAYAFCTHLSQCSPTLVQLRYIDEPTCEANQTASCVASVNAGSSGATPTYEETCSQVLSTKWTCADFLDYVNAPPECATPSGRLANGSPCALFGQCQSAFCATTIGNNCGVCAAPPNAGDSCATTGSCGRGLDCSNGVCVDFASLGNACGTSQPCAEGLGCANGTCQTETEVANQPCEGTENALCDFATGLVCNTMSSICQTVEFATSGQPCATASDGQRITCVGEATCTNGMCSAVSSMSGPCDIVNGPICISPLRCIVTVDGGTSGTCTVPDPTLCL